LVAFFELRSEIRILRAQSPLFESFLQHMKEFVELERLSDKVRCPPFDGINSILHRAEASNDDRDDAGIAVPGSLDDTGAVDARQAQVSDDDIERELFEQFQGSF